jgi:Tol biopolymer transport system component
MNPGTRLGPYEIVAPLGEGGMGEVYRATDTRLGRQVAIKVLSQHLVGSSEVRARFEREAKTISSLNHPHICVLHDVGREADTDFLVMELIEGESLAQRLTRGALSTPDVLKIGSQVADALDRAHRAGIVHRDLKPGNIMLTKSGAKLMDFGLARSGPALGASSATSGSMLTQSPTVAQPLTAEGTILGTYQYMAPEQLEGQEVDGRADLWALGCVLYEMASGNRAFEGATKMSLISSIIRDTPRPLSELVPVSPAALERLVMQCLAKDRDDRWQSAGDVRRELDWIASGASSSGSGIGRAIAPTKRAPAWIPGVIAGTAIAVAALAIAFGPWRTPSASTELMRFELAAPKGLTLNTPADASFAPDGKSYAFTASDSSGVAHILVRTLASREPRVVPGSDEGSLPFWSPDGRQLGFFAKSKLMKVALDGSAPVALCAAPDGRGAAWSQDGVIYFAPDRQGPLYRVPATGGTPSAYTSLDASHAERGHRYPQILPDGKHVLYVAIGRDGSPTMAVPAAGGKPVEVCRGGSMGRFVAPGWLLYLDGDIAAQHSLRLLAKRFDPASLKTSGDAMLVLDAVNSTNFGYPNVAEGPAGKLIVQHWENAHQRLTFRDLSGAHTGAAIDDFTGLSPALSDDGRSLAYCGSETSDLYIRDLPSGQSNRVTFRGQSCGFFTWSHDSHDIYFSRLTISNGWQIFRKNISGGDGADTLIYRGPGFFTYPQCISRDKHWLVAKVADSTGNFDLYKIPLDGSGSATPYEKTPENEDNADLSPDGRWIAYATRDGGRSSMFIQSFPEPGQKYEVSYSGGGALVWNDKGDQLLVITQDNKLVTVAVDTHDGVHLGAPILRVTIDKNETVARPTPDWSRILTGAVKDGTSNTDLEMILGWPKLLEQSK